MNSRRVYDPSRGRGGVEVVEDVETNGAEPSASSTNSAPVSPHSAVYPVDSVLEPFMAFARRASESEDSILIGSLLPVVAGLLARRVFIQFGERKYPNLYSLLVTKPGLRKSTSIRLAQKLARALLPPGTLIEGAASDQALFDKYLMQPDKLMIEEEGNTILSNWANDAAGKIVAKRFLRLYDCAAWEQSYVRQKDEGGQTTQRIDATSTSLLIGTTFNNCRFNGLETSDGMRRRVAYYVSERLARTLYFPESLDSAAFDNIVHAVAPLADLSTEMKLSEDALPLWCELQDRNRADIESIEGIDRASEAYGSALAEEGSRILKLAMIFEACRWAANQTRNVSETNLPPSTDDTASPPVANSTPSDAVAKSATKPTPSSPPSAPNALTPQKLTELR